MVFEADDAVHDRSLFAANPNLDTVPGTLRRQVVNGTDGYRDMLTRADHVLASTPRLEWEDLIQAYAVRDIVLTCDAT